ncbi:hypothetical protein [Seonamhaeicola sp.]|uniref:hypothetical protein n=1 Tax=Seonamhaeicola sp. TaxID=1912245 RepID=UPI00261E7B07|nr:hypothetical protein [Seonamhaeicola sp.]
MSNIGATPNIMGFEYQNLIALLKCLEAKDHTIIYLECNGDVSDETTSSEIKHSIDPNKTLHETHIDFWKTLGNIAEDYEAFSSYSKLILHTTAKIKEGSIFSNWENLSSKQKADSILKIAPNNTIKKHFDKVKKCNSSELSRLLERFVIEDKQLSIHDLYNEKLLNHVVIINSLEEKNREPLVQRLMGYIDTTLIKSGSNNYIWKINVDDFRSTLQSELKKYQIEDFIFPIISKTEVIGDENEFSFTEKLKEIDYMNMVSFAVNDYLRAQKSRIKMIIGRSNLSGELDLYDEEISESMLWFKAKHIDKLENPNKEIIKEMSKKYYDECLLHVSAKTDIEGVKGVREYYPKGRLHFNAEEDHNFKWMLKENDES